MRKIFVLILFLCFAMGLKAQLAKTVNINAAGSLRILLTHAESASVTDLTVSGTIDARDFKFMRDSMPRLVVVDISQTTVAAYKGPYGSSYFSSSYKADEIPEDAFNVSYGDTVKFQSVILPQTIKSIGPAGLNICTNLKSIDIPASVTVIHERAFSSCKSLTSITIPESVRSIGQSVFSDCRKLASVSISSSVDSIQPYTFSNCDSLRAIHIPSSVTYIGDHAFSYCRQLKSVSLSPAITTIGRKAFYNCSSLTGPLDLPQGLQAIRKETFSGCSSLTTIGLPLSVDSIGSKAFAGCVQLSTVTLPPTLKYIESYAFDGCTSLTGKLALPSMLKTIGLSAFNGCSGLTSITIPSSVISLQQAAFQNCSNLTLVEVNLLFPPSLANTSAVFNGIDFNNAALHVPYGTKERYANAMIWKDFKTIEEGTCGFLLNSTAVSFEADGGSDSSIVVNGNFNWEVIVNHPWIKVSPTAGNNIQALTITADANQANGSFRVGSITLRAKGVPDQTIYVSQQTTPLVLAVTAGRLKTLLTAYQKATITRLKLTGTLDARDFLTIGAQMHKLEYLDIRETDILAFADSSYQYGDPYFYPANTIPSPGWWNADDHVRYSIYGHPSLMEVKLPLSLGAIGLRAFSSCMKLKTVELNSPVTNIHELAFWDCESLMSINLSPSVASIGREAFAQCTSLTSIELSSLQRVISSYCFSGCTSLKTLDLPNTITSIGEHAFEDCTSLQSVIIPSSLTTVGYGIFYNCSSLTSVQIAPTITTIEPYAFSACTSLPSISLPGSVAVIDIHAFYYCNALKSIYCYAKNPPKAYPSEIPEYQSFGIADKNSCTVYVPFGSKTLYTKADGWKEFDHIVEMPGFSLSDSIVMLEAKDNSRAAIQLLSNLSWHAVSNQPWLTISPKSGDSADTITCTAQVNTSMTERTAKITVSAPGADAQTITVIQKGITVGEDEIDANELLKVYPNPFTNQMVIEVENPSLKEVTVEIYSISGQRIKTLARAQKGQKISLVWKGDDEQGKKVMQGVYLLKVNGMMRKVVRK